MQVFHALFSMFPKEVLMSDRHVAIEAIVASHRTERGALLSILEAVQRTNEHNYLSKEELVLVAKAMEVPLSTVYSVATFYAFFNLKPQGEHVITVCRGTACHTRGSKPLLQQVLKQLNLELDEEGTATTDDVCFTVHTVACFGQCALAPVIAIDSVIHSRVTEQKLTQLLQTLIQSKEVS